MKTFYTLSAIALFIPFALIVGAILLITSLGNFHGEQEAA